METLFDWDHSQFFKRIVPNGTYFYSTHTELGLAGNETLMTE